MAYYIAFAEKAFALVESNASEPIHLLENAYVDFCQLVAKKLENSPFSATFLDSNFDTTPAAFDSPSLQRKRGILLLAAPFVLTPLNNI